MLNFSHTHTVRIGSTLSGHHLYKLFDFMQCSESVVGEETSERATMLIAYFDQDVSRYIKKRLVDKVMQH